LELLRNQYDEELIESAVLMAGGQGRRLRPLTEAKPKPLLKIGENTILDNVLGGLKKSGVRDIAISVNYLGEQIKEHVNTGSSYDLNISYLEEKKILGTAGALALLEPRPRGSFIVMNADLLTDVDYKAMTRFHKDEKNDFSVCVRKIINKLPFGVVNFKEDKSAVASISEKPENEYMVNAGIYVIEPEIINLVPHGEALDMVSLINKAIKNGFKVGAFPIYEYWRDIGRHEQLELAAQEMRSKGCR
jgi:NDP-sugar pyrophosphorylase family protein